jgi:hypothetical protein
MNPSNILSMVLGVSAPRTSIFGERSYWRDPRLAPAHGIDTQCPTRMSIDIEFRAIDTSRYRIKLFAETLDSSHRAL